eukprot:gene31680-38287_t
MIPSVQPSVLPSAQPTPEPSAVPSRQPSAVPSREPSVLPTMQPSVVQTDLPSKAPLLFPTVPPSSIPSWEPTTLSLLPKIESEFTLVVVSSSSANMSVTFDLPAQQPGQLFCAAFSPNFIVSSADQVLANGISAVYEFDATGSYVMLSDLIPSSSYDVFCALRGINGVVSELNDTTVFKSVPTYMPVTVTR